MKNKLLTILLLFSLSISVNAQFIASGPASLSSYFICNTPGLPITCGWNNKGQLGDGSTTDRYSPIQLAGITDIIAMSGGQNHSLFLKSDGTVWASGKNGIGQLGDGTTTDRWTQVQVTGLSNIRKIIAGSEHSLFLKNDGTVWACGSNAKGELGDGTTTNKNIPVQVSGLSGITAIAAGYQHSLFLKDDGTVWACGFNSSGQLGVGTTIDNYSLPIQVNSLSGITAIAAGGQYSLFLKNDGSVWGTGNNGLGALGDGTITYRFSPVQVSGLSGIKAITAGFDHSLFLKDDGSIWVCGSNEYGQFGNGTTTNTNTPVQISGLGDVKTMAAGSAHSLFLKNDGSVWGCGYNENGGLGDGTNLNSTILVQMNIDPPCRIVGIEEPGNQSVGLMIFPNPANNKITIKITSGSQIGLQNSIKIYNVVGQIILHESLKNNQINISKFPSGVYYVVLFDGSSQTTGKFVKQ